MSEKIGLCYICGKPIHDDEAHNFEASYSGRLFLFHKTCDESNKHRGCPNCGDDCQGWIVEGKPC